MEETIKVEETTHGHASNASPDSAFIGQYVLCRCDSAGVHTGELVSIEGEVAVLKNSRRLWHWKVKGDGIALSGVAQSGLAKGSKVDAINPLIRLTGVIETIVCSDAARESINGF